MTPGGPARRALAAAAATVTLASSGVVLAQEARTPRAMGEQVAREFVRRDVAGFMDYLLGETDIGADPATRQSLVDNRGRFARQLEALGTPAEARYAGRRVYGPGVETHCFVVAYRRWPLVLSMRYYEAPGGRWVLNNIGWVTGGDIPTGECAVPLSPAAPND